ncbi:siphovirus Gp157 family protein [Gracilimonas sp. BCB1]|uniref:siphovirus Gp157 family protein n=1 Tax=Gracilimonas sp. BCB1 TaxID=3152362 RepID=UPI0032D8F990
MNTTQTVTPTTKESLFEIGEHFYALESLLIESGGEITDEVDQWLNEYEGKEVQKIEAYCYLIQKFEEIADEAQRLAERSTGYRKKVSSLKERLKLYLEYRGKEKVETSRFTVTVCGNGGLLPVKLQEDVSTDSLPEQFIRVFKEPDMSRIREALLEGDEQAHLFAKVEPRGTHLRIK